MRHTSTKFDLALGLLMAASVMRRGKSTAHADHAIDLDTGKERHSIRDGYNSPKPVRKFTDARKAAKAKAKRRKYK